MSFQAGGRGREVKRTFASRDLLRTALVLFGLFLAWRFVVGIATAVLVLLVGLLLAVALSWPVEALHRHKVPRSVASVLVTVGTLALLGLGGYLFFPEFEKQVSQLSFALPSALYQIGEQVEELASRFGLGIGEGNGVSTSALVGLGRRLLGGALGLFMDVTSILLGMLVAVFVAVYLAASPGPVVGWVVRLFPTRHRPRVWDLLSEIRVRLLSWLKGRLASMAIVGALSTVALYVIGIPGALLLGLFTGLISFVPYIGPIVSVIPPVLLTFAFGESLINALWVVVAYVIIQQVESNLITPVIMQKVASLHPAVAIAAVTLLGTAFGLLGALLALPAAVVAGILIKELWFRRLEAREPEDAGPEDLTDRGKDPTAAREER